MGKLSSFFKTEQFQIRSEVYCYQWWPLILWAGDQLWAKMSFSGKGWGDEGARFGAGCEHASIRQQEDYSPPGLPDLPGASRDIHDCCAPECIGGGSCGCSRQRQLPWNSSSSIPPSPASPTLFSLLSVLRQWLHCGCWWRWALWLWLPCSILETHSALSWCARTDWSWQFYPLTR